MRKLFLIIISLSLFFIICFIYNRKKLSNEVIRFQQNGKDFL